MIATCSLFVTSFVLRGIRASLSSGGARLGADLVIVPEGTRALAQEAFITGQPTTFYMDDSVLEQVRRLAGVRQVSAQVYIQTLINARCCIGEFFLVGFDPDSDFTISPWRITNLSNEKLGPFDIVVGDRILLSRDDRALFYGSSFRVAGVLEKTGMGIDRTVYVPMEGVRQMITDSNILAENTLTIGADEISSVMVKVEASADVMDIAETVEQNIPGVEAIPATRLIQAVAAQMRGITFAAAAVLAALWLLLCLMIGLAFSLMVGERKRELGLLRAMGAQRGFVFRLIVSEAALLTGMGGVLGLAGAGALLVSASVFIQRRLVHASKPLGALSRLIQLQLNVPYLLPSLAEVLIIALVLLVLTVLSGSLASLQPAVSISRMEPHEAIRRGE